MINSINLSSYFHVILATNLCFSNNGGCEQLCLPTPQYTVICTCADGFELKADEKTCLYRGKIYIFGYFEFFVYFQFQHVKWPIEMYICTCFYSSVT